jgi:hypothetical protein
MWVLGGCLMTLILGLAGAGYGIHSFVQRVRSGSTTCLPSDFPSYPGSVYVDESFGLNDVYPGITCHLVLHSDDSMETVTAFYVTKLNTGPWQVGLSGNPPGSVIFQRVNNATPFGTVQVAAGDPQTVITIDTYTSTCLPLGFPRFPGAKFGGQSFDPTGGVTALRCHVVFVSNDSTSAVVSFYKAKLNSGKWHIDSSTGDRIQWVLLGGLKPGNGRNVLSHGTLSVGIGDDRSEIEVDSS